MPVVTTFGPNTCQVCIVCNVPRVYEYYILYKVPLWDVGELRVKGVATKRRPRGMLPQQKKHAAKSKKKPIRNNAG